MSKALEWLEAESDRLEKECNENNNPHKTVNHSFLEGFNYALLNAQALEQIQLDDNQHRLLDWLTEHFEEDDADALGVVCAMQTIGLRDEKIFDSALKLNDKQQAEVLQAFSAWVLEQEEV